MATKSKTFSAEERAAMKARAQELKAAKGLAAEAKACKDAIAKMSEPDRSIAKKFDALIKKTAPDMTPRTWYGMPAYAKDGETICFFKPGAKFRMRYSTFGFSDKANVDDGNMWPTDYALMKLTPAEEKKIAALVKKAIR